MNTALSTPSFWVVIPAAGIGSRMGMLHPKQYLKIAGCTVLEHSVHCFLEHPGLQGIVVSLAAEDQFWNTLPLAQDARILSTLGGSTRARSVQNALDTLLDWGAQSQDWVLVHDAARPNLASEDLEALLTTLATDSIGGLLAVPVRDTLKRVNPEGRVLATVARADLWQALTPQMFRIDKLSVALCQAASVGLVVTDEASAIEAAGWAPKLVQGRADNLKITLPEDLLQMQSLWASKKGLSTAIS